MCDMFCDIVTWDVTDPLSLKMKEKQQELARGDSGDMSLPEGRGEEMLVRKV